MRTPAIRLARLERRLQRSETIIDPPIKRLSADALADEGHRLWGVHKQMIKEGIDLQSALIAEEGYYGICQQDIDILQMAFEILQNSKSRTSIPADGQEDDSRQVQQKFTHVRD